MEKFQVNSGGRSLKTALLRELNLGSQAAGNLIREGQVKVNGRRIRENITLSQGDVLEVYLPASAVRMPEILFAGEHVLAVEKPTGAAVCDAEGLTVEELLHRNGYPNARPVHRLDVYTGGVLLFALDEKAEEALGDLLRGHLLNKEYECVVRGTPSPREAVCRAWLRKDAARAQVRVSGSPSPGAREIVTGYRVLASRRDLSRLRIRLYTGRTHQIRAHMAYLGHPLLGDDLYGDRDFNKAYRLSHPLLWACSLTFPKDTVPVLAEVTGKVFVSEPKFPGKIRFEEEEQ